jgi:hypothetical protein
MKPSTHKLKPQRPDDDVWTWVVIGLVYAGIMLALYAPLVWERLHSAA